MMVAVTAAFLAVSAETLTYDGENRLTSVVLAGETVTISEDVTIATGATVSGYGSLTFSGTTATEGLLMLSSDQSQVVLTGPATLLDTNFVTVVTGADLDSLVPGSVTMGGQSANGTGNPYNVSRGPGWLEVQYHNKPSSAIKVVKARFEQSGADVVGKVLWAGYSTSTMLRMGTDFDLFAYTPTAIATQDSPNNAYGIKSITFAKLTALDVVFAGKTTIGGVVSNATAGVRVTMDNTSAKQKDGTGAFYIAARSQSRISNPDAFTVTGLSGSFGDIVVETDGTASNPCTNFCYDVLKEMAWTVVATNASLAHVTNITAKIAGSGAGSSDLTGYIYRFSNDGHTLTCQFQNSTYRSAQNNWIVKGVALELRQSGCDIIGRTPAARYFISETGAGNPAGLDLLQSNCSTTKVATATTSSGYCLYKTTLLFDRPLLSVASIADANNNLNGTLSVKGTAAAPVSIRIDSSYGLPKYGEADILANGEMVLYGGRSDSTWAGLANGQEFNLRVHSGGVLKQYGKNVFGSKLIVSVDGGELMLGYGRSDEYCQAYLPQLFLRNGARVTGLSPRVGNLLEECVWKVYGTSPSVCSNNIILIGTKADGAFLSKWVLDVADTDSGDAADFKLCGNVTHYDPETYYRIEVEKRGAGVLEHGGEWIAPTRRIVKDGTWRFAANGNNANADMSLEGGNLEFAAGTTNALGTLTVSHPATLTFGGGARVAFADSAATTWDLPENGTINVIGAYERYSLRFGTSKTLGAKVRKFRMNGTMPMHQDSAGYIVPGPKGLEISFR